MASVGRSKRFALGRSVSVCSSCGFYSYEGWPAAHLLGCKLETDPDRIREHQLHEFGRALSELFAVPASVDLAPSAPANRYNGARGTKTGTP